MWHSYTVPYPLIYITTSYHNSTNVICKTIACHMPFGMFMRTIATYANHNQTGYADKLITHMNICLSCIHLFLFAKVNTLFTAIANAHTYVIVFVPIIFSSPQAIPYHPQSTRSTLSNTRYHMCKTQTHICVVPFIARLIRLDLALRASAVWLVRPINLSSDMSPTSHLTKQPNINVQFINDALGGASVAAWLFDCSAVGRRRLLFCGWIEGVECSIIIRHNIQTNNNMHQ